MKKALLIDDEERMLELLALYLEPYQYDCRKALGAKEGLQYIEEERFDIVLLDIMMPDMDGIAGIAQVKKCWPTIKIIAIFAGVEAVDKNKALKAATLQGADLTLAKPFTDDDMIATVDGLLDCQEAVAV